jgi:methylenetetrahydrofolate reductase (NADPH)
VSTTIPYLLRDFSLEITAKDVATLDDVADVPAGTQVNVTFLSTESHRQRVTAAEVVRRAGLVPVPHVSARRIASEQQLDKFLADLTTVGAGESLFLVGGDPERPVGPYADAASLISAAPFTRHRPRTVGVAGYPDGHPHIDDATLWDALEQKIALLSEKSVEAAVITQFSFDASAVVRWLEELRGRGVAVPVRVGVPGPAGIRRLLGYARRFGVASSAGIVQKYGFSLTNLLGTAGPDVFLEELAGALTPEHGDVAVHFYTFGGLKNTARWAQDAIMTARV